MEQLELMDLNYEEKGRCAWLTMNRPDVRNALSKQMFRDLAQSLAKASKDPNISFIAITGAGDSFSAGLDIKQVGGFASKAEARSFVYKIVKPFWQQLFDCEKPILSVVNGPAYGAGAEIALGSDIVIASPGSKFAFSGGRVGALCCVSAVIGPLVMDGRKVVMMNLTGSPLSADEARDAGLVTLVATQDEMSEAVIRVLGDLEKVSPISNSSFKRIRREMIPDAALEFAYRELFKTITSLDFRKGAKAFLNKQAPSY